LAATFQEHQGDRTDYKMATITITTDFAPEIWEQIKEYAGIFPLPANIVHFDKLTFEELEDSIDDTNSPFTHIGIESVYDILVNYEDCVYAGYSIYYYDGAELKGKEKKEWVVKWLKKYYRDEYGMRQYTYAAIKDRRDKRLKCGWGGLGCWVRRDDVLEFWNEVSELITECFKKREEKKEDAKKKRATKKAYKETPKGMIAEINKIENERRRLMKRRKDDKEKLDKLTIKGDEWRAKLNKKRDEIRYSNDKK